MFLVEAVAGWLGDSSGLIADSLDMLADASVYSIALYAVGRNTSVKRYAARASGWIQISLGLGVLIDAVRRFLFGSEPISTLMMSIGFAALVANVTCLLILSRHRKGGVHMRASWIFSTNDVLANCGVILSGALVWYFGHRSPDLIVGTIVSVLVVHGGLRILEESKPGSKSKLA
jgi:Co/Zn/Cd efflux system component